MMHKVMTAIVLVFLGAILAAQAAPITNKTSWSYSVTDWGPTTNQLAKFDTHLGTLTQMLFSIQSVMDTSFTATEKADVGATGKVWTVFELSVADPNNLLMSPELFLTFPGDAPTGGFNFALAPLATTNSPTYVGTNSFSEVYAAGAPLLTEFSSAGGGNVALDAYTLTSTYGDWVGGNADVVQHTHAGADVSVIYNYIAIPEPATLALTGLGCLAFYVRRRHQQSHRT